MAVLGSAAPSTAGCASTARCVVDAIWMLGTAGPGVYRPGLLLRELQVTTSEPHSGGEQGDEGGGAMMTTTCVAAATAIDARIGVPTIVFVPTAALPNGGAS
jgi:hypothetical protein